MFLLLARALATNTHAVSCLRPECRAITSRAESNTLPRDHLFDSLSKFDEGFARCSPQRPNAEMLEALPDPTQRLANPLRAPAPEVLQFRPSEEVLLSTHQVGETLRTS